MEEVDTIWAKFEYVRILSEVVTNLCPILRTVGSELWGMLKAISNVVQCRAANQSIHLAVISVVSFFILSMSFKDGHFHWVSIILSAIYDFRRERDLGR